MGLHRKISNRHDDDYADGGSAFVDGGFSELLDSDAGISQIAA